MVQVSRGRARSRNARKRIYGTEKRTSRKFSQVLVRRAQRAPVESQSIKPARGRAAGWLYFAQLIELGRSRSLPNPSQLRCYSGQLAGRVRLRCGGLPQGMSVGTLNARRGSWEPARAQAARQPEGSRLRPAWQEWQSPLRRPNPRRHPPGPAHSRRTGDE